MSNVSYDELVKFLEFDDTTLDLKLNRHAVMNQLVCEGVITEYEKCLKIETEINKLKLELELSEATMRLRLRDEAEQKGKKVTVDQVKDDAATAPNIVTIKSNLLELQSALDYAKLEHTKFSDLRYNFQSMSKNMENKTKLIVSGFIAY